MYKALPLSVRRATMAEIPEAKQSLEASNHRLFAPMAAGYVDPDWELIAKD